MTHLLHAVHAWSVLPAVQPQSIQGLPAGTLSHDFTFLGFVIILILIIMMMIIIILMLIMIIIIIRVSVRNDLSFLGLVILEHQHYRPP